MWKLESEQKSIRTWRNITTNSECQQVLSYTDAEGNKWWEFSDLLAIPFTRSFAATKIASLYALGLTMEDVTSFISKQKETLKGNSPEKYEKAYADILDFESKVSNAADPVRQMSSLVCVYFTLNDEPVDSFQSNLQASKLSMLEARPEMHSFFLKRQIELIEHYKTSLIKTSQTVLNEPKDTSVPLKLKSKR